MMEAFWPFGTVSPREEPSVVSPSWICAERGVDWTAFVAFCCCVDAHAVHVAAVGVVCGGVVVKSLVFVLVN